MLFLHVGHAQLFIRLALRHIRVWWWSSITFHRTKRMCFIFLQPPSSFVIRPLSFWVAHGVRPMLHHHQMEESPFRIMILRFCQNDLWSDGLTKKHTHTHKQCRQQYRRPIATTVTVISRLHSLNVYLLSLTENHSGFYGHGFLSGWMNGHLGDKHYYVKMYRTQSIPSVPFRHMTSILKKK